MRLRDELTKMFAAEIGPPVGNPEWLAKHGERLTERNQKTAERWADLSAKVFREWLGSEGSAKLHADVACEQMSDRYGIPVTTSPDDIAIAKNILAALASLSEASE